MRSTIYSSGWINLVFENLNQKYGAYVLRKMQGHFLGWAILVNTTVIFAVVTIVLIARNYVHEPASVADFANNGIVELVPPPVVPVVTKPPSPSPAAPKPQSNSGIPVVVKERNPVEPDPAGNEPASVDPSQTGVPVPGPGTDPGPSVPGGEWVEFPPKVYRVVEINPSFPGGDQALVKFLRKHIRYPQEAKRKGINGTVNIEFTVNANGTVSDIYINSGIGGGCEQEAIRVVSIMPEWKPGRQSGIAVPVRLNLPIRFSLK